MSAKNSGNYKRRDLRRKEFPTTETELSAIAAAAMTGLNRMPNTGYRMPAATGTPAAL